MDFSIKNSEYKTNSLEQTKQDNESQKESKQYFYYEVDGAIQGPIEDIEFYKLIKTGKLQHETLFCVYGASHWKNVGDAYKVENAPLLPISYISNGYAVTLALMPLLQSVGIKLLDQYYRAEFFSLKNNSPTIFSIFIVLYFLVSNTIFLILDIHALDKRKITFGKAMFLWGNIIPTYLFHRGTRLARIDGKVWNSSHLLAFIWLASAIYVFNWKYYL